MTIVVLTHVYIRVLQFSTPPRLRASRFRQRVLRLSSKGLQAICNQTLIFLFRAVNYSEIVESLRGEVNSCVFNAATIDNPKCLDLAAKTRAILWLHLSAFDVPAPMAAPMTHLHSSYAIAARPLLATNDSNFNEGPAGFFSPRSHLLM